MAAAAGVCALLVLLVRLTASEKYKVGVEVRLDCQEVSPDRVSRVKFFRAGTEKPFYEIEKYAADLVFMTPTRRYEGQLGHTRPFLLIHEVNLGDTDNYTCQVLTRGQSFNKSSSVQVLGKINYNVDW